MMSPVPHRRRNRSAVVAISAVAGLLLTASEGPAATTSIKAVMKEMAGTTKLAKEAVGSGDLAKAEAVLKSYAGEARSAAALVVGGDAKALDLRRRFTALGMSAEAAEPARLKPAFAAIVEQCRSCHALYK